MPDITGIKFCQSSEKLNNFYLEYIIKFYFTKIICMIFFYIIGHTAFNFLHNEPHQKFRNYKQMEPNQTYKLLYSKGNPLTKQKTTYRLEEIFANDTINKDLISKIYK